jgi:ubiquitin-protein ligase
MKEITNSPIEGIGIISLLNDPMQYIVNIKLMQGPYKNYCVQLLLTFPDNYPTVPPKILIYPDQAIDGNYHHHIFPDISYDENGHRFKKFCFDLLDNDFMSTKEEGTGWNPSYTISSLLLQVQNFLSDPDMPESHIPNKYQIDQLMNSMNNYQRSFKIENDKGEEEIIVHTWNKPYPEMYYKKDNEDEIKNNKPIDERMQQIKENLTCFMLKSNYIDDPDILLGYPIIQSKAEYGKDKYDLYPIPELLTYEGFVNQIGKQDIKLDYYFDIKFKSANNQFYNYWIPIYINDEHYKKNKQAILNSFSIIKYGAKGKKKYDFKPEHIFEVLPLLLNKMIIGIFSGKTTISSSFIRCYFHYVFYLRNYV